MKWLILGYFVILMAERIQSIVRSINCKDVNIFGDGFNIYVYSLTFVSLLSTIILLIVLNKDFIASFVSGDTPDYGKLCITMGVLLLSGMVHTEFTIAPLQFVSYGMLIAAMIIQTVKNMNQTSNPAMLWLSLVYLILFSMAIPVMYKSQIDKATVFHIIEAITAFVLVIIFSIMMYLIFTQNADNLFYIIPIVVAAVCDAIILTMRWNEKVNTFVLIFIIASIFMWIAGKIVFVITNN